jgi:hypothetical protein
MGVLLMPQLLDLIFKQSAIIITGSEQPAEQMMNEANETIFNNWKNFIYTEAERIVDEGLRERERYDSLKSKDWGNQICEQVPIGRVIDNREASKHQPPLQVHGQLYYSGIKVQRDGGHGLLLLRRRGGRHGDCQVGKQGHGVYRQCLWVRSVIVFIASRSSDSGHLYAAGVNVVVNQ